MSASCAAPSFGANRCQVFGKALHVKLGLIVPRCGLAVLTKLRTKRGEALSEPRTRRAIVLRFRHPLENEPEQYRSRDLRSASRMDSTRRAACRGSLVR